MTAAMDARASAEPHQQTLLPSPARSFHGTPHGVADPSLATGNGVPTSTFTGSGRSEPSDAAGPRRSPFAAATSPAEDEDNKRPARPVNYSPVDHHSPTQPSLAWAGIVPVGRATAPPSQPPQRWPLVALFPASYESVWSVRIHSTTLARLLHGFVLLPSGISGKMIISLDTITIIAILDVSFLSLVLLLTTCVLSLPNAMKSL